MGAAALKSGTLWDTKTVPRATIGPQHNHTTSNEKWADKLPCGTVAPALHLVLDMFHRRLYSTSPTLTVLQGLGLDGSIVHP
jgi:hypothetical protein